MQITPPISYTGQNTISGKEGTATLSYIGNDGKAQNAVLFVAKDVKIDMTITTTKFKAVGTRITLSKAMGLEITVQGTIFYGSPLLAAMIMAYKQTGVFPLFSLMVNNHDISASSASSFLANLDGLEPLGGVQSITALGCLLDGDINIATLDQSDTPIEQSFKAIASDIQINTEFGSKGLYDAFIAAIQSNTISSVLLGGLFSAGK